MDFILLRKELGRVAKALGIVKDQKAFSISDPSLSLLFGVRPTYSGVNMSGTSALSVPAVLQAARLISENIGSLPCKLYGDLPTGKEQAKDHSAFKIVHNRANGWTSAGQIRTDLTLDALVYGNGFAKVIRYPDGRPFELVRLKPGSVSVYEDTLADLPPAYRVTEAGGVTDYPYTDILHVRAFGGASPVSFGREAIGLAAILERHGAQFFSTGARPSGIISNDKPQGSEAGAKTVANIRASFREWQNGSKGDPLIMDGGWKYDQPAMTSTDAQFLENRVFQIDEIARIFGVPPTMLFELTRGTWSNTEEMARAFNQLCLRPWLDRWQDAYATVLLTEDEQEAYSFEFVIDDLQRANASTRAEIFSKLVAMRAMTPNEVRAAMNMPPLPGGDELANPYTTTTTTGPAKSGPDKEPA